MQDRILDRDGDTVLTLREVIGTLREEIGGGNQAFYACCDWHGVFPGEGYGDGEVITVDSLKAWLAL
jgi:hypothetical protein